jgi:hypothetical protein
MLVATMVGIFLVPVLFVLVERLVHREAAHAPTAALPSPVVGGGE